MTPNQFSTIFLNWDINKEAQLKERLINGPHEQNGGPGVHSPGSVGRTLQLIRNFGYPPYKKWVEKYFESGRERLQHKNSGNNCEPSEFGRTAEEMTSKGQTLLQFLQMQKDLNPIDYTHYLVTEWLGHLVLVRSWRGGHAENFVLQTLNRSGEYWRPSSYKEDVGQGVDLVNDKEKIGVQVKKFGWSDKRRRVDEWIRRSEKSFENIFLIEYLFDKGYQNRPVIKRVFHLKEKRLIGVTIDSITG